MERVLEFIVNHPWLISAWGLLLFALLAHESRRGGKKLTPLQATLLVNRQDAVIVDVRDRKAFANGHITGALHMPFSQMQDRMAELEQYRDRPLIIACEAGQHSGMAGKLLAGKGYSQVYRISGGLNEWRSANFPLVRDEQQPETGNKKKRKKKK